MTVGYLPPKTRIEKTVYYDGKEIYTAQVQGNGKVWHHIYEYRSYASWADITYFTSTHPLNSLEYAKEVIDVFLTEHIKNWEKSQKTITYIKYP